MGNSLVEGTAPAPELPAPVAGSHPACGPPGVGLVKPCPPVLQGRAALGVGMRGLYPTPAPRARYLAAARDRTAPRSERHDDATSSYSQSMAHLVIKPTTILIKRVWCKRVTCLHSVYPRNLFLNKATHFLWSRQIQMSWFNGLLEFVILEQILYKFCTNFVDCTTFVQILENFTIFRPKLFFEIFSAVNPDRVC